MAELVQINKGVQIVTVSATWYRHRIRKNVSRYVVYQLILAACVPHPAYVHEGCQWFYPI